MHRRNWWPLAAVVLTAGAAGAAALRRRKGAGGDWVGSGGESTTPSPEVMTPGGSRMDNPLSPKR